MSTPSSNMGLSISAIGVDSGFNWETNLNASLLIIDQHNHSPGQGVAIQPNGLNINSDLPFGGNNATLLRSSRYAPQGAALSLPADLCCVYAVGAELYYNDGVGNQVQITTNGSVNAGAGSITGLPSGTASATYSAGTFVWQSATSTAANMDGQSFILRNSGASSKALTLQAPAAMAANFSLTLPTIPAAQNFMAIDASGNLSAYAPVANGITRPNLAAVGQQISSNSGSFSTASGTLVAVTNLSVTITTSGRPVMVLLQGNGSGQSFFDCIGAAAGAIDASIALFRGATEISNCTMQGNAPTGGGSALVLPPSAALTYLDTPSASTYTYAVKVSTNGTLLVDNVVLVAFEL